MALRNEYDAIIVGAGHNGLILAGYMARAGLEVVVLERYLEQGGGLDTHVDPHYPGCGGSGNKWKLRLPGTI